MFKFHNQNPLKLFTDDCTIRAISMAEGTTWDYTYDKLKTKKGAGLRRLLPKQKMVSATSWQKSHKSFQIFQIKVFVL